MSEPNDFFINTIGSYQSDPPQMMLSQEYFNSRLRLKSQQTKRKVLQYQSQQKVDYNQEIDYMLSDYLDDPIKINKVIFKSTQPRSLRGKAQNIWNEISNISQKYVDQQLTQKIINDDVNATIKILSKFEKQKQNDLIRAECVQYLRKEQLDKLRKTHDKNLQLQQRIGTAKNTQKEQHPEIMDNHFNYRFTIPQKHANIPLFNRLAQPKSKLLNETAYCMHSDFVGLLQAENDEKLLQITGNKFLKKIVQKDSNFKTNNMMNSYSSGFKSERPKSSLQKLSLTAKNFRQKKEIEIDNFIEDIDKFDQQHAQYPKQKYPKVKYIESKQQINLNQQ